MFRLGTPIVIGQIGMIVLGLADTLMIGHHTTAELGAASFVNSMFNFAIIFSMGFTYSLTPIIGGYFGTGEYEKAGKAFRIGLIANLVETIAVVLIMTILYLNIEHLGQPKELIPLIKPYYLLMIVALVFKNIFGTFKQFSDSITETQIGMWIVIGGNVLNIIGNYILIYGKFGFPEWGLFGAGASTLFANIVMVMAFIWILGKSRKFGPYRRSILHSKWSQSLFSQFNKLGWPIAWQMGMETASFSLSTLMAGWLGTIALASHQVMLTISTFTFMIYYGIGAAVAIRVSNFNGQNDIKNIRITTQSGFHLIVYSGIVTSLIIFLLRYDMGGWFTTNPAVSTGVTALIWPFLIYQFGDGLQINYANALRGISDVKVMMWIAFISYFIIALPVGYIFAFIFGWGLPGIWMNFCVGLTCAGLLYRMRFHHYLSHC